MVRACAALMVAMVAAAACGRAADPTVAVSSPPTAAAEETTAPTEAPEATADPSESAAFPACADVPDIAAPAAWYRDQPIYVGNEQPTSAVREWARARPGYQDIWIDRDHLGWITVAFSGDTIARQAELEAGFPGVGVVAVEAPTTMVELRALQRRADRLLRESGVTYGGSGVYSGPWVVGIDVDASDERLATALAPIADDRICVNDTGTPVPEGPQPDHGDGWRLLGEGLVGEPYRTGIATEQMQYARLWADAGLTGPQPAVDFDTEVVVWFGAVYGSSCPIRLDGVVVDTHHEPPLVHAIIVVPGGTGTCTADANPHGFVVAVDRDRLPGGPFAIQLGPDDPPPGAPEERTVVDADLSAPGAVADDEQIGSDDDLIEASSHPRPVESGAIVEPGFATPFRLDTRCGIGVLGEVNGIWWVTGTGIVPVPSPWADLVEPDSQTLVVELLVTPWPDPTATATAGGHSVVYEPVPDAPVAGCG